MKNVFALHHRISRKNFAFYLRSRIENDSRVFKSLAKNSISDWIVWKSRSQDVHRSATRSIFNFWSWHRHSDMIFIVVFAMSWKVRFRLGTQDIANYFRLFSSPFDHYWPRDGSSVAMSHVGGLPYLIFSRISDFSFSLFVHPENFHIFLIKSIFSACSPLSSTTWSTWLPFYLQIDSRFGLILLV